MNFADLQVFKSVVDEGGVIKAASKLHRVPSAVTTRIKQLEASMGVKLFHRNKQRLHLSPAGELLLDYADRLIQLSNEARDVVSGTMPRGVLKLGALESTTASRLPPILAGFHGRYPEVRLELVTGTNDALLGQLAERRLDAAFIAEAPAERAFEHIPVFAERLMLISSPDHPPIKRARDVEGNFADRVSGRLCLPARAAALARPRQPRPVPCAGFIVLSRHRRLRDGGRWDSLDAGVRA